MIELAFPDAPAPIAPADLEVLRLEELRQTAHSRGPIFILGAATMIFFAPLDRLQMGAWSPPLLALQLVFALTLLATGAGVRRGTAPQIRLILCVFGVTSCALVAVMVMLIGGEPTPVICALVVVPFGVALLAPGDTVVAAVASLSSLVSGMVIFLVIHTSMTGHWVAVATAVGAIAQFMTQEEKKRRLTQLALLQAQRQTEVEHSRDRLQLQQLHTQLRTIIHSAPLVCFRLDPEGRFTFSEGRGLTRLGLRSGEVVGRRFEEVYGDEPQVMQGYQRAQQGNPSVSTMHLSKLKQDWQVWWTPAEDTDGSRGGVVGVGFEITDRVAAEHARQATDATFRSLIEGLPDSVFVEVDGHIVYANPRAHTFLGYDDAQLRGRAILDLVHPEERQATRERIATIVSQERPLPHLERRVLLANGGIAWAEATGFGAVFEGQRALIAIARDTTERRELQDRLRIADRMASVGTLAAGVAHEINNPLSYVMSNLQYALELNSDLAEAIPSTRETLKDVGQVLSEALEGATRVRNIVRDLKSLSRPDDASTTPVDVHGAIESAIHIGWNQIRHRARLVRELGPIPPVLGNEAQLGQVLLNLLVNAAQAIPDGHVDEHTIRVVTRDEPESGQVVIQIVDDGSGIPADILPRIFDPFFTTKEIGVGTGLGLSICMGLVTGMGGEMSATSAVGQGTTLTLRLPATSWADHPNPEAPAAAPARAQRHGQVWLVDDDVRVLSALSRQLRRDHFVTGFTEAQLALEAIRHGGTFDLMLCDLMMPSMNGMEFFGKLEALSPALAARVVFVTGGAFTPEAARFVNARRHLDKPVELSKLRSLVREMTAGAQS